MTASTPENWRLADDYLANTLVGHEPGLEQAIAEQHAAAMPAIEVAPLAGKLLMLLAQLSGARRVLEIGTLGGYSTIWLARGIPSDGRVVTLEAEPAHAAVARASIDRAGVGEKVEIMVGIAADTLPTLEGGEPFDPMVIGTRNALAMLGSDPRFEATALQTVGMQGWDGVALAVVT